MNAFIIWIESVGGAAKAADLLQVTPDAIRKWARRDRLPRPDQALTIERVSGGSVKKEDWYWPEVA